MTTENTEPTRGPLTDQIASASISKQQQLRSDQSADNTRANAERAIDAAEARVNTPTDFATERGGQPQRVANLPPAPAPAAPEPGAPSHYDNLHAGGWTPAEIAARAVVDLESISLIPNGHTFVVGDTKQMAAYGVIKGQDTREINQSMTWVSDKPSIVSVSGAGFCTAVAPGTATLTATNGPRNATMNVTVTAPIVPRQ
jgi:uncharacterized protein YjdB